MSHILILYSTVDGHTLEICRRLRQVAEGLGHQVSLASLAGDTAPDPSRFDKVIIGASIRYGKHRRHVVDFVRRNLDALQTRPSAFFSVNVVARKPGKNCPATNPYLGRFLARSAWRPTVVAVFAGMINYPRYGLFDRAIIRLIMWMTGGPTDPDAVVDFTDWQQVEAFGRRIAEM